MNNKNIIALATKLENNMEYKELDNGIKRMIVSAKFDSPIHKQLMDLTFKVDQNTNLGTDSVYSFTQEALSKVSEMGEDDEMGDLEIEADIYTSDLTSWLNESNYHVDYLTEALQEFGTPEDGCSLLSNAQYLGKRDVMSIVIDWLENNIN